MQAVPELSPDVAACGHEVELRYGDTVALAASNFTIPRGRVTCLIGPNGSGKSTVLAAIAGLHEPSSGRVEVLGASASRSQPQVAFVPQSTRVDETLPITVREVVMMGRYPSLGLLRPFRRRDHEAVTAALRRLDIEELAGRHLGELSGGQRQRVFVAQGIVQEHEILLMDEAFTALDLVSAAAIAAVVADKRAANETVVLTTHDLAEAAAADHVVLLAGRVVAEGPPERVLVASVLSDAYATKIVETDGRLVYDDPAHRPAAPPHVHVDRAGATHQHP